MLIAISTHHQGDPTIPVVTDSIVHPFMVDTGATYSCIGKKGSGLPLSKTSVKTISGKLQVTPQRSFKPKKTLHSSNSQWHTG